MPEQSMYGTSDRSRARLSNGSPCSTARSRSRSSGDVSMVRRPPRQTSVSPSLRVTVIFNKLPIAVA